MSNIYGPILPLQLDSRNTAALVRAIQTRINLESGGVLNDFTPASPLSAISEGQAYAQAELLYYLNNLPEAFSLQWLRQLGVQRRIGSRALVDVTFYKTPGYTKVLIIPAGTKVYSNGGLVFILVNEVRIPEGEFLATGLCKSERWGSVYNVGVNSINKIEKNFLGLDSLLNQAPAAGGKDLESINEMKQRAFEVLSRRNLTTSSDFENEILTLAPDASIVKVLTYEERYNLSSALSGNVVICLGNEDGRVLSDSTLSYILESIRSRVTLGTNVSVITPEIIPTEVVVEVYYNREKLVGDTGARANEILSLLQREIDPSNILLGESLHRENLVKSLYTLSFVESINIMDIRMITRDPANIEGLCAGFSGVEDETNEKCQYDYVDILREDNNTYTPPNGITSYKLYNAYITLTDNRSYSPLTYSYTKLYTP